AVSQAVSMLTAIMPASIREAIFLSFIMNFSSLWCIKDRDPKQVERKVLSFQKHYSIPPPVSRPDLQIFGFCFLFFSSRRRRESIFLILCVILRIFILSLFSVSPWRKAPGRQQKSACVAGALGWFCGKCARLYNFCEKECLLQIARQGHDGREDGQRCRLAAEDAGAEADGLGAGGGGGRGFLGGKAPFRAGHNGDAQGPVRRGGGTG